MSRKSINSLPHPLNAPHIVQGCRSLCPTILATTVLIIGCNEVNHEANHDTRTIYIDSNICIPFDPHALPICHRPIPLLHLFEEVTDHG